MLGGECQKSQGDRGAARAKGREPSEDGGHDEGGRVQRGGDAEEDRMLPRKGLRGPDTLVPRSPSALGRGSQILGARLYVARRSGWGGGGLPGRQYLKLVGLPCPQSLLPLSPSLCASSSGFLADNSERVGSQGRAKMPYKLVMLGNRGVSKSAQTLRFLLNRFEEEYEPTLRNVYRGQVMVDGERCQLAIVDITGRFQDIREDCMDWGHGFFFVYTIDSIRTFVDVSLF
ncbi:uncharacterized protein LOC141504090 [Macrotis lagotis]|uniref:uncharacterized protein LOC141504090 n=1 Tax=Macrotis lagotis TaxID=92651 RepID=UPI003D688873